MILHDAIHFTIVGVTISAVAIKLIQLRFPRPTTNRSAVIAMCAALFFTGVAILQEAFVVVSLLERSLGIHIAYAQRHTPAIIACACVRVAFVCWGWPEGLRRRRRIIANVLLLGIVLIARWSIAVLSPPQDAAAGLAGDWTVAPWTTAAALLYIGYTGLTCLSMMVLSWSWARDKTVAQRWTATGLKLIVAFGVAFELYIMHKVTFMLVTYSVGRPGYNPVPAERPILLVALLLLVVGLAIPLVATGVPALRLFTRQRSAYRRLSILWLALVSVRREVVMMTWAPHWVPNRWVGLWEAVDAREIPFRLFRRVIECWDIVRGLCGHLDAHLRSAALREAHVEVDAATAQAIGDAVMLRAALDRIRTGAVVLGEAQRVATPNGLRELGENAAWWLRVARVWEHPLTLRLASAGSLASAADQA